MKNSNRQIPNVDKQALPEFQSNQSSTRSSCEEVKQRILDSGQTELTMERFLGQNLLYLPLLAATIQVVVQKYVFQKSTPLWSTPRPIRSS